MSDFKDRLLVEKEELDSKIEKLSSFIGTDNFTSIDPKQQELLQKQLLAMGSYSSILTERISLLN